MRIGKFLAGPSLASIAACALLALPLRAAEDIVDTAVAAGNFKTLAAALEAAGLVDALKGDGPFTVFAPTDEAFAQLPDGTVETLLKPENRAKLTAILTYHVVAGKVPAKQVVDLSGAETLNGQRVDIKVNGSTVLVDGATVVKTDIECSNGIIHVIDAVILPEEKTIPQVAESAEGFSTLLAAVKAAGLAETLSGEGPFTVFAPTDEAFGKLPDGTVESLLKPANRQKLVDILKYHVVSGRVYSGQALEAGTAKTLLGSPVGIQASQNGATVNDANLVATDIDASNGVIHVIDAVLMPPAKGADAKQMIENVVAEGAALFNSGHHAACASLYRDTMHKLMSTEAGKKYSADVQHTLSSASAHTCATQQAWALRHGLDRMYSRIVRAKH